MKRISRGFYKLIIWILYRVYPGYEIEGVENVPDEPVIFIGNHSQIHGPLAGELYFPFDKKIWCAGEMMNFKEVPAYAYEDFWSEKPKTVRWIYKIASYLIAPLAVILFNNAGTIPVYHDTRILQTFKSTLSNLQEGKSILIFPEHKAEHNHIVCDFQQKFVDVAKMYYNKYGKCLSFVTFYLSPELRKICFSKPITYCPDNDITEERTRVCNYLMDAITKTAVSLPVHTVVPYINVDKKQFKKNK